MAWKDLNMNEKAAYISIAVLNGLLDRESIIGAYNKFNEGGDLKFYGNRYDGDTMPSQLMQVAPAIIGRRPLTEEEKQSRVMYDTEGNPILLPTHGLYNMDTNELINRDFWKNGKYIYDGVIHLPPELVTNLKDGAWYNNDMFGYLLGDLRVGNYLNILRKNPNFSELWDPLANIIWLTGLEDLSRRTSATLMKGILSKGSRWESKYSQKGLHKLEPLESAALANYLLPPVLYERAMKDMGYIKGIPGDYGLVKKAVGDRNLPVWLRFPDADGVTRNDLDVIANTNANPNVDFSKGLLHAGSYPSAIYTNKDGSKFYVKSWDLNDYGASATGDRGGAGSQYSRMLQLGSDILDNIGNPAVITSGFLEISPLEVMRLDLNKLLNYVGIGEDFLWKYKQAPYRSFLLTEALKAAYNSGHLSNEKFEYLLDHVLDLETPFDLYILGAPAYSEKGYRLIDWYRKNILSEGDLAARIDRFLESLNTESSGFRQGGELKILGNEYDENTIPTLLMLMMPTINLAPLEVVGQAPQFSGPRYNMRKYIYNKIAPTTFEKERLNNLKPDHPGDGPGGYDRGEDYESPESEAAWAFYLGLSDKDANIPKYDFLEEAEYAPTMGTPVGPMMRWKDGRETVLDDYDVMGILTNPKNTAIYDGPNRAKYAMGDYTVSRGYDDKGLYVSYYDDWDLNLAGANLPDQFKDNLGTRPFTLYDRKYLSDEEVGRIINDLSLNEEDQALIWNNIRKLKSEYESKKKKSKPKK